jgi:predicted regulator of Ras-like GTPase activity (Roadblock/LC7/MglB family)
MDFADCWKQLLSESLDIQGGAFFTTDGVLISQQAFATSEISFRHIAAAVAIAHDLANSVGRGELDVLILEDARGYIVLIPVMDKAILTVAAQKQAKLGLVMLDMRRAIDKWFGPGLAGEPVLSPLPPKHDSALALSELEHFE